MFLSALCCLSLITDDHSVYFFWLGGTIVERSVKIVSPKRVDAPLRNVFGKIVFPKRGRAKVRWCAELVAARGEEQQFLIKRTG